MRLDHLFTSVLFLSVVPRALSKAIFSLSNPDSCTGGQYAVGVGVSGYANATGWDLVMRRTDSNGDEVVMSSETTGTLGTAGGCTEAFEETTIQISVENPLAPVVCSDTDDGATDSWGDSCEFYDTNSWGCSYYDDEDFSSDDMCCACGGGASVGDDRTNLYPNANPWAKHYYVLGSMAVDGVDYWQVGRSCEASEMPCSLPSPRVHCDGENDVPVRFGVHNHEGNFGGSWQTEITWRLDENNNEVLSGGAPFDAYLCMNSTSTYVLNMEDSFVCRNEFAFFFFFFLSLSLSLFLFYFSMSRSLFHCILSQTLNDDQTPGRWLG